MVWSLKLSLESVSSSAWRNKKFSSASKVVQLVFAQRFITIFNCRYHTSNHLSVCHKHTSLSPINCQSVDNCCIITFAIRISRRFSSVPNGEFPEILIAKCKSRFFSRAEDFESWQKGPSKSGEKCSLRKVHMYGIVYFISSLGHSYVVVLFMFSHEFS